MHLGPVVFLSSSSLDVRRDAPGYSSLLETMRQQADAERREKHFWSFVSLRER